MQISSSTYLSRDGEALEKRSSRGDELPRTQVDLRFGNENAEVGLGGNLDANSAMAPLQNDPAFPISIRFQAQDHGSDGFYYDARRGNRLDQSFFKSDVYLSGGISPIDLILNHPLSLQVDLLEERD